MSDDSRSATRDQPKAGVQETRRLPARGRSADALDAYTSWLNRVGAAVRRRGGLPPALYNLQAYKSWAAKIRRDWQGEPTEG